MHGIVARDTARLRDRPLGREAFRRELRTLGPGSGRAKEIRLCRRLHPPLCSLSRGRHLPRHRCRSAQTVRRPARRRNVRRHRDRRIGAGPQCRRRPHFGNGGGADGRTVSGHGIGIAIGCVRRRGGPSFHPTLPRLVRKPPFRMRRRNALRQDHRARHHGIPCPAGRTEIQGCCAGTGRGHPHPSFADHSRVCRESRSRKLCHTPLPRQLAAGSARRKKRWYSRWWKSTMRGLGLHK